MCLAAERGRQHCRAGAIACCDLLLRGAEGQDRGRERQVSAAEPPVFLPGAGASRLETKEVRMRGSRVASKIGVILVTGGLFVALTGGVALAQGSPNGASTQRPVFYEGQQVTVNMFEVPASDPLLAKNKGVNTIYATNDLDEEQDFLSVIDAVPGDGMNPLWHQVLIVFNQGFTPHQFTSEDEVLAAAAGPHPEIRLVSTDEVYRCSVVRSK